MHHSLLSTGEGGGASYQIFKKGGLPESQFLEDDCWEKGGDFFMGSSGGGGGGGGGGGAVFT